MPDLMTAPLQAFELLVPTDSAAAESHYDRSELILVSKGQQVARLAAPLPESGVTLGAHLSVGRDGLTLVAESAGQLRTGEDRLWIEPALEIAGNVDFSSGNIDFDGDVVVRGNVVDLFKVNVAGDAFIAGAIEAAEVRAGKSLLVRGGIAGREKCVCAAGHDITARFVTGANLRAGNDIVVRSEVANSQLICGGKLQIPQGAILGSDIVANGGIVCHTLGSVAGTKTLVEVGRDESLRPAAVATYKEVDKLRHDVAEKRKTLEPMMRDMKKLSARQKESVTEQLYEIEELEAAIKAKLDPLLQSARDSKSRRRAEITVQGTLHAGVTVRIDGLETQVTMPFAGPLKLRAQGSGGSHQIVLLELGGQSVQPLGGKPIGAPANDPLLRAMKEAAP